VHEDRCVVLTLKYLSTTMQTWGALVEQHLYVYMQWVKGRWMVTRMDGWMDGYIDWLMYRWYNI
jgi:hypothetical protein